MTYLFWFAAIVGVAWGVFWVCTEVFRAWTTPDRFKDITELLERER